MPQSVLIVDDSIPLHALIKTQLRTEPLSFHSAHDGETAVSTASSYRPDLILLDIDMPGLSGFEVCQRLKSNPQTATIPLIFLTADTMLSDKIKGLELGGSDYIVKPFKPEDLKARVRSALRFSRQFEPTRMIDDATGLWNQNYFDIQQKAYTALAKRTARPLSCIVAEIDRFKEATIKFGQPVAREIERKVADLIRGKARVEDVVCRLDDGVFAILMTGIPATAAAQLAERLRADIEKKMKSRSPAQPAVTCSFGVADTTGSEKHSLLERAQNAAARSQKAGRNCVSMARENATALHVAA